MVSGLLGGPSTKRLLFVTGTRADFGKLRPLIQAVEDSEEFEAHVFATGMHLQSKYGFTLEEVQAQGYRHVFPFVNQDPHGHNQMDMVMANTVRGLGYYLREFPAQLIVIHGDRVEALAGALVGALNNTLVAHIEGGELSGTIDEHVRHAVTKLSHLHFVANDEARGRLIQMGEDPGSAFVIGSPDIDVMLSDGLPDLEEVCRHYEIPFEDYGILLFHPVTTELGRLQVNAEAVVEGVLRSGRNFVVIYPNNDAGSGLILAAYNRFDDNPACRLIPSMRFEYFLTLLKHADVIVGNSSAGVREAPVYGVPSVDVGSRQNRRFRHTSIVAVEEDSSQIERALRSLPPHGPPSFYFGAGNSTELFMAELRRPEFWAVPTQKQFQDLVVTLDEE